MNERVPAEPIPFRVLLDEAMKLTRRHFGKMYLPVAIPLALLGAASGAVQLQLMQAAAGGDPADPFAFAGCGVFAVMLVSFALTMLTNAVLTSAAMDGVMGRPILMKAKWGFVLRPATLWTLFMAFVAVVAGLCLLIFPGIYIGLRLSFLVPVMAAEGVQGRSAMRRSWELVKYNPHKRFIDNTPTKIFVLFFVAWVITWLVTFVVQLPLSAIQGIAAARETSSGQTDVAAGFSGLFYWMHIFSTMLGQLVSAAVGIYTSSGLVLLYLDVVRRKEGKDLASAIEARFGGFGSAAPVSPPS